MQCRDAETRTPTPIGVRTADSEVVLATPNSDLHLQVQFWVHCAEDLFCYFVECEMK